MTITQTIQIDFARPTLPPCVPAVQGDTYTREVTVELYAAGVAWELPEGHDIAIRYRKPDGTTGIYDTLPDNSVAWASEGNTVSVMLCPQMLTVPGKVPTQVSVIVGDRTISTFAFVVAVEADPSKGAVNAESYNNWRKAFLPQTTGAVVGQYLQITKVDAEGRVIEVTPVDAPSGGGIDGDLDMKGCNVERVGSLDFEPNNDDYSQAFWMQAGGDIKNADGSQTAVAEFFSSESDLPVVLRFIAPGIKDTDAVNLAQLKTRLIAPIKASVGQYIRITAVDENGAVTAVEAVDAPSGSGGANEVFVKTEDGETLPAEIEFDLGNENTPALVVAPDTAKVGQTIIVKSVDENGKPTEWEAVDLPIGGGASQNRLLAELTITESVNNITFDFPAVTNRVLIELDTQNCAEFSGKIMYIKFGSMDGIYPQPFSSASNGNKYYALAEIFAPGIISVTTWGGDSKYSGYSKRSTLLWNAGDITSFVIMQYGDTAADFNGAVLKAYGG